MSVELVEPAPALNLDPRGVESASLRARLLGRLRGERSLRRMRRRGLRAEPPVRVGLRVFIDAEYAWAIEIGAFTILANDVRIIAHDAAVKRITGYTEVRPVKIGQRCYLGAGSLVLPGAEIGDDAIIGAADRHRRRAARASPGRLRALPALRPLAGRAQSGGDRRGAAGARRDRPRLPLLAAQPLALSCIESSFSRFQGNEESRRAG
jgi:hypothetical protein